MDHLTIDEILEFVDLHSMDAASVRLCARVNGHIRKCEKCFQLVSAFQLLYDEFTRVHHGGDFKRYAMAALEEQLESNTDEVYPEF